MTLRTDDPLVGLTVRHWDHNPDYTNSARGWDYLLRIIAVNEHDEMLCEWSDGSWEVLKFGMEGVEVLYG